jgi:hypothetical protein
LVIDLLLNTLLFLSLPNRILAPLAFLLGQSFDTQISSTAINMIILQIDQGITLRAMQDLAQIQYGESQHVRVVVLQCPPISDAPSIKHT